MDYHYRPPTASSYGATNPPYGGQGQAPYAGHASQGGYPPYNARPNVPAGGGYGYPTPAPPQQPQAQPPSDPFRAYYAGRLRELTFNSRPIIQDLSLIAMQQRDAGNWPNMNAVVEEIEGAVLRVGVFGIPTRHIPVTRHQTRGLTHQSKSGKLTNQASPQSKLPILYLIDSISKNVGAPYTTTLLPPIIPRLYRRTYREVDGVTKAKMEEMIALWRTGGPNRTDLYGPDVRLAIERDIFGSAGAPARPTQQPQQRFPTKDQVLQTLHATLDTKQRESATKPWDATPRHQVGVLQQIAQLLATTDVSPQELQNIMEQLKSMVPPIAAATPPTHTTFTPPPYPPQPPSTTSMPAPNLPPFPPPLIRDEGYRSVSNPLSAVPPNMTTPTINGQTPVPGSVTPVPVASSTPIPAPVPLAPVIPANVADILRNLNSSGLLSNPRTPDSANVSLPTKNLLASYEDMVLSMDLRLESLDLNRYADLHILA
jgi:pre-mRNA cleavage complex 2 protein Pcf11